MTEKQKIILDFKKSLGNLPKKNKNLQSIVDFCGIDCITDCLHCDYIKEEQDLRKFQKHYPDIKMKNKLPEYFDIGAIYKKIEEVIFKYKINGKTVELYSKTDLIPKCYKIFFSEFISEEQLSGINLIYYTSMLIKILNKDEKNAIDSLDTPSNLRIGTHGKNFLSSAKCKAKLLLMEFLRNKNLKESDLLKPYKKFLLGYMSEKQKAYIKSNNINMDDLARMFYDRLPEDKQAHIECRYYYGNGATIIKSERSIERTLIIRIIDDILKEKGYYPGVDLVEKLMKKDFLINTPPVKP